MNEEIEVLVKADASTKQYIGESDYLLAGYVAPFFDFSALLSLFYANVYHRRCAKLTAGLLSNILESDIQKYLPSGITPRRFVSAVALDLVLYGNAFIEKAGTPSSKKLYWLPGFEGRLTRDRELVQVNFLSNTKKLNGYHFSMHSPRSRYYGEPEYLASLRQIDVTQKADIYNDKFFENGARPDLAFIFENSKPTKDQIDGIKSFLRKEHKGYENAHKAILLWAMGNMGEGANAGIRIEKLGEITDLSFEKLKSVNRDEIITAWGVPPRLVGVVQGQGLGGSQELSGQLHAYKYITFEPLRQSFEEMFSCIGVKLKIKELDISDFRDDTTLIDTLLRHSVITPQEAKDFFNFDLINKNAQKYPSNCF